MLSLSLHHYMWHMQWMTKTLEKIYFTSQILKLPCIYEYWNISGILVLPKNVIFEFCRTCYPEAHNTGKQKWSSTVHVRVSGLKVHFLSMVNIKRFTQDKLDSKKKIFRVNMPIFGHTPIIRSLSHWLIVCFLMLTFTKFQ